MEKGVVGKMTEAQKELVVKNHALIFGCLKKYNMSEEEGYGLAAIGLCEAALKYNKEIGAFSTYAYRVMGNKIMEEFRKSRRSFNFRHNTVSYYSQTAGDKECSFEFIETLGDETNVEFLAVNRVFIEDIVKILSSKEKEILKMQAVGFSQNEIAEHLGISQPSVSHLLKTIRDRVNT